MSYILLTLCASSLPGCGCDGGGRVDTDDGSGAGGTTDSAGTPDAIASTVPPGGAVEVSPEIAPQVTFDREVDESTITDSSFAVTQNGGGAITGSRSYDANTKTVTFTPETAFEPQTSYTLTVTSEVKDPEGASLLSSNYSYTFTTRRLGTGSTDGNGSSSSGNRGTTGDGGTTDLSSYIANSSYCRAADDTFSESSPEMMVFTGETSPFPMTWGPDPRYSNCTASLNGSTLIITCDVLGTLWTILTVGDTVTLRTTVMTNMPDGNQVMHTLSYYKCQ